VADALLQSDPDRRHRSPRPEQPQNDEQRAEELRRYLENLDPEDFGKFNP